MKNKYLIIAIIAFAFIGFTSKSVFAQCTPKRDACEIKRPDFPACLTPEVAKNGEVGKPYDEVIQLNFGRTAPAPSNPIGLKEVYISRLRIVGVDNLPEGLEMKIYSGNPKDQLQGGLQGNITPIDQNTPIFACATLTGKPMKNTSLKDSITLKANVYVKIIFNGMITGQELNPDSIPGITVTNPVNPILFNYKVPIGEITGLNELWSKKKTTSYIQFNSANETLTFNAEGLESINPATLKVYNSAGQVALSQKLTSSAPISVADLKHGVYFVKVEQGNNIYSLKFLR